MKLNGRSFGIFPRALLLPLNMCIDIRKGLAHMWEPILESKRYHILLSDFIFKSQFLPRSKISNSLRFWISIDLNILESFLGEKCGQFLIFYDKTESFSSTPPQFMREVVMYPIRRVLQKIFDI